MQGEMLHAILDARHNKSVLAVVTRIADGTQCRIDEAGITGSLSLDSDALSEIRQLMRDDRSATIQDGRLFVHVHHPPPRLIIVGAVHIAQVLAPMADLSGLDVTVVDPRGSFATADRFPGIALNDDWPDEALESLAPDSRTAVVTLTHDPKLDDPALEVALRSPAYYIASLGGARTHSRRLERLRASGFDNRTLERINGPAGLPIGAVSPAEIAVSILAQLTAVRHGRWLRAATG